MTSQIQTTQDTNPESSETSSKNPSKTYSKDTETTVMGRVNAQRMKFARDPNEDDFIETSEKMVKTFAGDPDYSQNYVLVSGIKVFIEGTVAETLEKEERPLNHRM